MKIQSAQTVGDAASSRAVQKTIRHQSHVSRTGEHRHERRKIREFLRHAEVADELDN